MNDQKKENRGGPRENAGRPRKEKSDKRYPCTISLKKIQIDALGGDGGVWKLLTESAQTELTRIAIRDNRPELIDQTSF